MDSEKFTIELESSYYCDYEHPAIQERVQMLAGEADSPEKFAQAAFNWVRDQIPFGLDFIKLRASETLQKGYGACYNKSLLLTTLLRANGIPARFCSAPVNRWFMKPFVGSNCVLINNPFHHCMVQVHLDGQWSFAEPTLDQASYDSLFRNNKGNWGIEWSQERRDRLYVEHLQGEPTIHDDIDRTINRKVGNSEMPSAIARIMYQRLNKKVWRRIGVKVSGSSN